MNRILSLLGAVIFVAGIGPAAAITGSQCAIATPRVPGRVRKADCSRWW